MIGSKIILNVSNKHDIINFVKILNQRKLLYGIDYDIKYQSKADLTDTIFYFKKSKHGIWFSLSI